MCYWQKNLLCNSIVRPISEYRWAKLQSRRIWAFEKVGGRSKPRFSQLLKPVSFWESHSLPLKHFASTDHKHRIPSNLLSTLLTPFHQSETLSSHDLQHAHLFRLLMHRDSFQTRSSMPPQKERLPTRVFIISSPLVCRLLRHSEQNLSLPYITIFGIYFQWHYI